MKRRGYVFVAQSDNKKAVDCKDFQMLSPCVEIIIASLLCCKCIGEDVLPFESRDRNELFMSRLQDSKSF